VKVEATANIDGSFVATDLDPTKADENQNIVEYRGKTTSAVGSDGMLTFTCGDQSFSFPIAGSADLKDFNNNKQSIGSGTPVKVKVLFNGKSGSVVDVGIDNGMN
jgi:hypothetical protein